MSKISHLSGVYLFAQKVVGRNCLFGSPKLAKLQELVWVLEMKTNWGTSRSRSLKFDFTENLEFCCRNIQTQNYNMIKTSGSQIWFWTISCQEYSVTTFGLAMKRTVNDFQFGIKNHIHCPIREMASESIWMGHYVVKIIRLFKHCPPRTVIAMADYLVF